MRRLHGRALAARRQLSGGVRIGRPWAPPAATPLPPPSHTQHSLAPPAPDPPPPPHTHTHAHTQSLLRFVCDMARSQADPKLAGRVSQPFYAVLVCEYLSQAKAVDEPLLT